MSGADRVVIVVGIAVFLVALVVWMASRFRRGGPGPPINVPPLTKAARRRVNRRYAEHGWKEPFDDV